MTVEDIKELLKREPFQPFRVVLTSGEAYEIRDPDLAVAMKSRLFIAFPNDDRYALCPYLHISTIETLKAA